MEADAEDTLGRRTALRKIGTVGAALWVAPVVERIVISPESAQAASGGQGGNGGNDQGDDNNHQ